MENGAPDTVEKKPIVNPDSLAKGPPAKPPYSAFSPARRRFILIIVTVAGFYGPLSGSIYLPALPVLERAFDVSTQVINATVSVFMAILAVAPLFWAAWSDFGGRKVLYMASLLIFVLSNVLIAALPAHIAALFILRILQAFGAASVMSLGAGTVADVVEPKARASALALVMLGPQLGPVLGPLLGGALAGAASWRWIFGFLAITSSITLLVLAFALPETLRSLVGNGAVYADAGWLVKPKLRQEKLVKTPAGANMPRPPRPTLKNIAKLLHYVPVPMVAFNGALLFAGYYAVAVTLPRVLQSTYSFTTVQVGVAYLCPGIALIVGSAVSGRVSDAQRARRAANSEDGTVYPETRLHLQIPGILLFLAGVLMFGWFCDRSVHVAAVLVATALAGFGMSWTFNASTTYLTECSHSQPATLVALAGLFRNPSAAVASAVIDPLIRRMGIGWCFTGLALVQLISVAFVAFLMLKGRALREKLEQGLGKPAQQQPQPSGNTIPPPVPAS